MGQLIKYKKDTKIGRLTIVKRASDRIGNGGNRRKRVMWECVCDCGNTHIASVDALRDAREPSCGCRSKEIARHFGVNQSLPSGEASFNLLYRGYNSKAKDRGLNFELSKIHFKKLTKQMCYYCGRPPGNSIMGKFHNGAYIYNGIDRIDNTKGYTEDNSVTCCSYCNMAKGTRSVEDFLNWLDGLVKYRNNL